MTGLRPVLRASTEIKKKPGLQLRPRLFRIKRFRGDQRRTLDLGLLEHVGDGFGRLLERLHREGCHRVELFQRVDHAYKATGWLYGNHPYHNYSLVATVGATRPKEVFYGNNRADFSFIPGNVAPGILFRQPDHFENYDDWPFLWGQNEGTIGGNTAYLIFGHAFKDMVTNR